MLIFRTIDGFFEKIARAVTAVAICIQMVIVFIGVVFRYFFDSPLSWSDEFATYLLVIITFFGAYVALVDKMLAKIELLVDRLPQPYKLFMIMTANMMSLSLLAAIAYFGTELALSPVIMRQTTPAMQLPMWWFFSIIPIAAVLMINHIILETYDVISKRGEGVEDKTTGSYV